MKPYCPAPRMYPAANKWKVKSSRIDTLLSNVPCQSMHAIYIMLIKISMERRTSRKSCSSLHRHDLDLGTVNSASAIGNSLIIHRMQYFLEWSSPQGTKKRSRRERWTARTSSSRIWIDLVQHQHLVSYQNVLHVGRKCCSLRIIISTQKEY